MKNFRNEAYGSYVDYDYLISEKFQKELIEALGIKQGDKVYISRDKSNGQYVLNSEIPFDYLISYSGAKEPHTNKFHATTIYNPCVIQMINNIEKFGENNIFVTLYFHEINITIPEIDRAKADFKDKIYRYYGIEINNVGYSWN